MAGLQCDRTGTAAESCRPFDPAAYKSFLRQIGYLLPEGDDFEAGTSNVDPEIGAGRVVSEGPRGLETVDDTKRAIEPAGVVLALDMGPG